ncbi:MAG: hypothetical protein AAGA56_20190 [Myxococcota bacterium]
MARRKRDPRAATVELSDDELAAMERLASEVGPPDEDVQVPAPGDEPPMTQLPSTVEFDVEAGDAETAPFALAKPGEAPRTEGGRAYLRARAPLEGTVNAVPEGASEEAAPFDLAGPRPRVPGQTPPRSSTPGAPWDPHSDRPSPAPLIPHAETTAPAVDVEEARKRIEQALAVEVDAPSREESPKAEALPQERGTSREERLAQGKALDGEEKERQGLERQERAREAAERKAALEAAERRRQAEAEAFAEEQREARAKEEKRKAEQRKRVNQSAERLRSAMYGKFRK